MLKTYTVTATFVDKRTVTLTTKQADIDAANAFAANRWARSIKAGAVSMIAAKLVEVHKQPVVVPDGGER